MRLSLGQSQIQTQKQILAPRMIQSMEILQLPVMALQERIEQEMNENPTLELRDDDPDLPDEPQDRENPDAPADTEKELVVDDKNGEEDFERLLNISDDLPETYEEQTRPSASRVQEASDRKHDAMANAVARSDSLYDYLDHQLGEMELDDEVYELAERIISSLDSNGWLKGNVEDLLPPDADEEHRKRAQYALEVVQSLDPPGVGARNLQDCLLLQLTPETPYYEELKSLITKHLEDLAQNRLPQIQKKTGYSIDHIKDVWKELQKLDPKPGAKFAETVVRSVTPDVYLERDDDGSFKVRLEDTDVPNLFISPYYRRRLRAKDCTPEEREFIKRKVNAAQWLIESIEQRRNTLTNVSQAIVDHQTRFIEEGPEFIQPLKMEQIAEKVKVHVTTVSRAVDDKWIQTPRGLFPLRRFFVGGTTSADGEEVAWDSVRLKLQEIVDVEDKQKPHSDDELVRLLKEEGITVARRTITKYRKKMGIPSSRQRREWN